MVAIAAIPEGEIVLFMPLSVLLPLKTSSCSPSLIVGSPGSGVCGPELGIEFNEEVGWGLRIDC